MLIPSINPTRKQWRGIAGACQSFAVTRSMEGMVPMSFADGAGSPVPGRRQGQSHSLAKFSDMRKPVADIGFRPVFIGY